MELATIHRSRRVYVAGLYVFALLLGAKAALVLLSGGDMSKAFRIMLGLVLAHVVVADARAISKPFPHSVNWQLCLFWPVAVPACVIALRKGRGILNCLPPCSSSASDKDRGLHHSLGVGPELGGTGVGGGAVALDHLGAA